MSTIRELVDRVHAAVADDGMDVSPADIGRIVGLFLEGIAHSEPKYYPQVDSWLQTIADECNLVRDEG